MVLRTRIRFFIGAAITVPNCGEQFILATVRLEAPFFRMWLTRTGDWILASIFRPGDWRFLKDIATYSTKECDRIVSVFNAMIDKDACRIPRGNCFTPSRERERTDGVCRAVVQICV